MNDVFHLTDLTETTALLTFTTTPAPPPVQAFPQATCLPYARAVNRSRIDRERENP